MPHFCRPITSVSGGSVLAAHLVFHWNAYSDAARATNPSEQGQRFEDVVEPLLRFMERDVRNRVIRRVPWLLAGRFTSLCLLSTIGRFCGPILREWLVAVADRSRLVEQLRREYETLFGTATLRELSQPGFPRLAILATEVASMEHAWFTADGFAQPSQGLDHQRPVGRDVLTIAQSVTASSAFPALFPPVRLDGNVYHFDEQRTDRYVTDAGVYDNLGISGFLGEPFGSAARFVFVSDATATSDWSSTITESTSLTSRSARDCQ